MTMREKMAIRMFRVENPGTDWDDALCVDRQVYLELADAALAALEEPTEAMLAATRKIPGGGGSGPLYVMEDIWRAMIGAAKGEG